MKNQKKRVQRQEVRRILAAMRKELKDYRLHYEDVPSSKRPMLSVSDLLNNAQITAKKAE